MSTENKFKNEMLIVIGEEKILLRPTFENISNLESKMGGIQYLAFKFGQGSLSKEALLKASDKARIEMMKHLPTLSECAQIIYFCQAKNNPEDPQEKEFSLDEIFEKLSGNLGVVPANIMVFMSRMMAGNKMAPDLSENTKKNSSKPSQVKSR